MPPHRADHAVLPALRRRPRGRTQVNTYQEGRELMAAEFCARCGAPLAPGAAFCGVCRTPVAPVSIASYQQYAYPYAPPQAPRIGGGRSTPDRGGAGLGRMPLHLAVG